MGVPVDDRDGRGPSAQPPTAPTPRAERWERAVWLVRWTLVLLVAVGAIVVLVEVAFGEGFTEEDIEQLVARFGLMAPVGFVIVFSLVGSLFVPTTVLTVVGATLFGPPIGFAYSMVGAFIAAMAGFAAARTSGRRWVERWIERHPGRVAGLDRRLERHGFTTALFMRLLYLPNGLINVVCGISAIPGRVYAVATFFGLLPMVLAISYITGGAKEALLGGDLSALWEPETLLSAALFLACVATPFIKGVVQRRLRARQLVQTPFSEISGVFDPVEPEDSEE